MHHYYGDGLSAAGVLPRPGQLAPAYQPFPAGNPARPSLRENFRLTSGIAADPIHLDAEGYLYKVGVQAETHFFPRFRGEVSTSLPSQGATFDGWTDGVATGTNAVIVGDDGVRLTRGIVSIDTAAIPDDAEILSASLYLLQESRSATNPIIAGNLGPPRLDMATGSFGVPEIEAGDATAAADASNVGCFVGTAAAEYYAWRIDLTPEGIAAINRIGLTQFRLGFTSVDAGIHRVAFKDGDALLASAEFRETVDTVDELLPDGTIRSRSVTGSVLQHRGIAEVLGSARPFLDLRYTAPVFADGFEAAAVHRP
jgi:hypothetical protein